MARGRSQRGWPEGVARGGSTKKTRSSPKRMFYGDTACGFGCRAAQRCIRTADNRRRTPPPPDTWNTMRMPQPNRGPWNGVRRRLSPEPEASRHPLAPLSEMREQHNGKELAKAPDITIELTRQGRQWKAGAAGTMWRVHT